MRAWEAAVQGLPPAGGLPGPVLRDEIPDVIESIAGLVDAPRARAVRSSEELSERHALQRLGVGFELAHVLMEYSVLRNCILVAISGQVELGVEELIAINEATDLIANRSVERFASANERLLRALDRISSEALSSKSLDELLRRILGALMQASASVDSVAILLKQDDGRLHVRATAGLIAQRDPAFSIAVGEGFSGWIAANRTPLATRSAANDPRVKSDFFRLHGIQGLYGVPLEDEELELIGVAHMASLTVHEFTNEEKLLFQSMARRATTAIVRAQLMERERAARDDAEEIAQRLAEDVRERKRVEEEREIYLGTISHDLRNPLAVIKTSAEVLRMQLARGGEAGIPRNILPATIGRIADTADRMDRLIAQLLDFARARHGGIPLDRRPTDLCAICHRVVDEFRITTPGREFVLDCAGGVIDHWDPDRLAQVVQNLVANAIEHGRADTPIELSIGAEDGHRVLAVTNRNEHGAVPEARRPHLFDPFYRGDGGGGGGLGLGLYICQQIARAHGGAIEVESNEATTTFTLRLPAH